MHIAHSCLHEAKILTFLLSHMQYLRVSCKNFFKADRLMWVLRIWQDRFNCSVGQKGVFPKCGSHSCGVHSASCIMHTALAMGGQLMSDWKS